MKDRFTEKQREAIAYYKAHESEWLGNPLYENKHVIIHDNQLVGIYDNHGNAFIEAEGKYGRGNYIIQRLIDPKKVVSFYYPALA